jgi:hypothetical protein
LSNEVKRCSPRCEFFRCGQKALINQRGGIYCRWADDYCRGASCNYAICARGRLLQNGICGLTIKRKTSENRKPEEIEEDIKIRLKGKALRRLGKEGLEDLI